MLDPFKKTQANSTPRDLQGRFAKLDPPFISFSITNPITYIRKWWKAVMEGEGIDLRLKVHPLTAVAIALAIGGVSFGLGRLSMLSLVSQYLPFIPTPAPTAAPNPWLEAAFAGSIESQNGHFFLIGTDPQAVILDVPSTVDLTKYLGRKILASGQFNPVSRVLKVTAASDLELITGAVALPTIIPTPSPTPSLVPTASPLGIEGSQAQK